MITRKQKNLLSKLQQLQAELGRFPTVRELGRACGISSPATIHSYLERLRQNGLLQRDGRSWELAMTGKHVPLVGIVPAGVPIEIFAALGEEIELPDWLAEPGGEVVAFRVQGSSMKDAYIQDNDVIVVRRAAQAELGEMVVALLADGTITLKRLKQNQSGYFLQPENPEFSPIHEPFQLVGKVIGVMRKYR